MAAMLAPAAGRGLERSCDAGSSDWIRTWSAAGGIELLAAWFSGRAYGRHRHDTYALCLTDGGAQHFDYRGVAEVSTKGEVIVLHPDEPHDGHAGGAGGFGYRAIYVDPARIADALRAICGRRVPLPFCRAPVRRDRALASAIRAAFDAPEPLAVDDVLARLAEALMDADPSIRAMLPAPRLDLASLDRGRRFLDAEKLRAVRSSELEAVTGLTRYELARQFRRAFGTSPYRYLTMRRLDFARARLRAGGGLADLALEAGFADQAHFTRVFKAAYGLTPGRYRRLLGSACPFPFPFARKSEDGEDGST
jgi:AraC-like DNA-binding protein